MPCSLAGNPQKKKLLFSVFYTPHNESAYLGITFSQTLQTTCL